jgi:hypothetical protein
VQRYQILFERAVVIIIYNFLFASSSYLSIFSLPTCSPFVFLSVLLASSLLLAYSFFLLSSLPPPLCWLPCCPCCSLTPGRAHRYPPEVAATAATVMQRLREGPHKRANSYIMAWQSQVWTLFCVVVWARTREISRRRCFLVEECRCFYFKIVGLKYHQFCHMCLPHHDLYPLFYISRQFIYPTSSQVGPLPWLGPQVRSQTIE